MRRLAVIAGLLLVAVAVALGAAFAFVPPSRPTAAPSALPSPVRPSPGSMPPGSLSPGSPSPGSPSPHVTRRGLTAGYSIHDRWDKAFTAELTVTNLSSEPVGGWVVQLRMPAGIKVTGGWNAEAVQVGDTVTLRPEPWNSYVGPGAAVRLGFQASGSATSPRSCTINGSPC